jgi:hypothetical protein
MSRNSSTPSSRDSRRTATCKLPRPTPSRLRRSVLEGGTFHREGFAGCRPAPMQGRGMDSAGRHRWRPAQPAIFNSRWTPERHPGSEQGIFEARWTPRHSAWLRTVPPIARWERCVSDVPEFGAGLRRSQDLRSCGHTRNRRFLGTARPGVQSGRPDCTTVLSRAKQNASGDGGCTGHRRAPPRFRSNCCPTTKTEVPRSINADRPPVVQTTARHRSSRRRKNRV